MVLPRLLGALAVTSVAAVLLAGAASAQPKQPLISGDERATVHDGNVTTCAGAGLPGTDLGEKDLEFTAGQVYLDLLSTEGVSAVVVKGGSQYNVYLAADLGDSPWLQLHSPVNASDGPAAISHWFACGQKVDEQPPGEEEPTPETPSETVTPAPTTTTTAVPAPGGSAGEPDELAATGFASPWLLGLGTSLVAAGAGVLFLLRRRQA